MLTRVLEPEVMDTPEEASEYDAMDHSAVNAKFAADFFAVCPTPAGLVLDVGTGTAQIPIVMARLHPTVRIVAIDLAEEMLKIARANIEQANLSDRITVKIVNGHGMTFADSSFAAVVSNSIIHHMPEPFACFAEMVRVCVSGGTLFVRDLLRPNSEAELTRLVQTYAGDSTPKQRQLFADSLRAALTLDEVRELVGRLGFAAETVSQTSDRHWTWSARAA